MTIKRLAIIAGVLFVILIGISIYTFAILLPSTSQAASTSQTSFSNEAPTASVTTTKTAKGRKYIGTIQTLGNQTFVMVLSRGKRTITVNVDANTTYNTSNSTITFSDLKVGEMVQVRGHIDPQDPTTVQAVNITVTSTSGQ